MRFQVPQFIEVEDKIFGPLTLKQFIYLAGGVGLSVVLFLFLPKFISFIVIIPVLILAGALAFYKVNNKPFVFFLESAFTYIFNPKLYIWQHEEKPVTPQKKEVAEEPDPTSGLFIPKLSDSKLKELTWSLDAKTGAAQQLDDEEKK